MANRQASFRSQPRRAVGEQLLIEEDEVIAGNVTRELEERPNNLEDIDVDAEEEFWNGGNHGDERGGTEVAQGGGGILNDLWVRLVALGVTSCILAARST